MSEDPNAQLGAMLQELYKNFSGRFQNIENFLVAMGQQMERNAGVAGKLPPKVPEFFDMLGLGLGRLQAARIPHGLPIPNLAAVEFKVRSQWGEDGIIEWLVAHLPEIPRIFIEFGVEDFHEANCRFLMENRKWKGLIFDGQESYMEALKEEPLYWQRDLTAAFAFVTAENIDELIAANGFAGEIGILSVDIDGNDYWVWERIACVNPALVICEMNGVLGDLHPITIPYNPYFERLKGHHSGQYFGASIAALRHLAGRRGYTFLGTNSDGINAFFVRSDLAPQVLPLIGEVKAWPSLHRDSRDAKGDLTFAAGEARLAQIADLPVIDVVTGERKRLGDLKELYSEEWVRAMNYR